MTLTDLSIEGPGEDVDQLLGVLADKVQARQRELSSESERLDALVASKKPEPLKTVPTKTKYQKGKLSWSGRGTQPGWVKQHLALGETLEELKADH